MSFCVFQTANRKAHNVLSSGPALRIMAMNVTRQHAALQASGATAETRITAMSDVVDKYNVALNWTTVNDVDLFSLDMDEVQALTSMETCSAKLKAWNEWREALADEVSAAAREKRMRSVGSVRGVWLLAHFADKLAGVNEPAPTAEKAEPAQLAAAAPAEAPAAALAAVSWALVAIVGDAAYAAKKQEILEALGQKYFASIAKDGQSTEDSERAFMASDDKDAMLDALYPDVLAAHGALQSLSEEPLVAFLATSDDAELLHEKATELEVVPELKHADMAVVKTQAWLKLGFARAHRIKHHVRSKEAGKLLQALYTSSPALVPT